MQRVLARSQASAADVPEDLRIFEERLGHLGIRISLPNVGPGVPLHPLEEIGGRPLSALILDARRGV